MGNANPRRIDADGVRRNEPMRIEGNQGAEGLPIGMQIVGKRLKDMELLAIAKEINKVVGNFQNPDGY